MAKRIHKVIKNEIVRAYERGDPTDDTARDFGVSTGYPSRLAKKEGKPQRRPRKAGEKHE